MRPQNNMDVHSVFAAEEQDCANLLLLLETSQQYYGFNLCAADLRAFQFHRITILDLAPCTSVKTHKGVNCEPSVISIVYVAVLKIYHAMQLDH